MPPIVAYVSPGPVRTLAGFTIFTCSATVGVMAGVALGAGAVAEGASVGAGVAVGGLWVVVGMSTAWVEATEKRVGLAAGGEPVPEPRTSSTIANTRKATPTT